MALSNTDLFVVQRPAGSDAGTYKVEWETILEQIAQSDSVEFKGTADFTDAGEDPSANGGRNNGDLWVNNQDGTFAWANPETPNKAVLVGDFCIWDANDGVWRFTGSLGGNTAPVTSVDATAPLTMSGGATEGDVVVESTEATTSAAGHVARLAVAADVEKDSTVADRATAVVTADLLQATNAALDAATAGGVVSVEEGTDAAGDTGVLTISPTSGAVKIQVTAESYVPYDFSTLTDIEDA